MDLSIIIVNHNTVGPLRDCLQSLFQNAASQEMEIWLVDNASNDGSVEMVQTQFPQVSLITNRENVGFARANNQALARAAGHYCLLLNPDTVVPPGALNYLVQFMEETPDAAVTGCAQVYPDGRWQITCHREITLLREAFIAFGLARVFRSVIDYGTSPEQLPGPRKVDWVEGGALLIRRTTLETVGPLDEQYFMYAEDADLCRRVRRANFGVYYLPDVQIVHDRGQSTGLELREQRKRRVNVELLVALHQSRAYFMRKHYGDWQERAYRLLVRICSLRKLSMGLAFYLLGRAGKEAWSQTAGAYTTLMTIDWERQ